MSKTLCEAEKVFILHGIKENFRIDGRERGHYRPMELEIDIVAHAFGSARLRLANTDVLVAVKIEVDVPFPEQPNSGKLEFFVDCSANATPDFEGRGGEDLAMDLANSLSAAYKSTQAFDLSKLSILNGRKCWKLLVDILILECGGNLYDAVSIAVKAALYNTRVPKVKSVNLDGNKVEMEVSDNIHECEALNVKTAPVMVTVSKIGNHCVVDTNSEEEQCSLVSVIVAVSQGNFTYIQKIGCGSLQPTTFSEGLEFGVKAASKLDEALLRVLAKKPNQTKVGFLS